MFTFVHWSVCCVEDEQMLVIENLQQKTLQLVSDQILQFENTYSY